ncbi:MAG: phage replisome organizer N-terminal domain-containing protein [Candidatus Pacearchaeota archaeon]
MRRNWIKLYVDQTLRGSCFDELLPDERFVWFGFLLLAGDNACEGKISITEEMGYTNNQLSVLLKCKKSLIERSIGKMIAVNKIKIGKNNVIKIVNWQKYQSEYQRQKPYRSNEKLLSGVTTEGDGIEREGERDIERDIDKDKNINIYKELLDFFNNKFNSKYRLTDKLKSHIKQRLKTYSQEEIKQAISIMAATPFYRGKNDRNWKADPQYLFRNDDNIDRLLNNIEIKKRLVQADKAEAKWNEVKEKPEKELTPQQKKQQRIIYLKTMINAKSKNSERYRKELRELEKQY